MPWSLGKIKNANDPVRSMSLGEENWLCYLESATKYIIYDSIWDCTGTNRRYACIHRYIIINIISMHACIYYRYDCIHTCINDELEKLQL